MTASGVPTGTVSPSTTCTARSTPATAEGTSVSTFSVDTSNSTSSTATVSPTSLCHRMIVPSVTVSPSCGIVTSSTGTHCTVARPHSAAVPYWLRLTAVASSGAIPSRTSRPSQASAPTWSPPAITVTPPLSSLVVSKAARYHSCTAPQSAPLSS